MQEKTATQHQNLNFKSSNKNLKIFFKKQESKIQKVRIEMMQKITKTTKKPHRKKVTTGQ